MFFTIISAKDEHKEDWKELWTPYHENELTEDVTEQTWQRILDPISVVNCFVAINNGKVVGYINYIEIISTWKIKPVCYISDIFVHEDYRRKGIAKQLILTLKEILNTGKWSSITWNTLQTNTGAQKLYDQFNHGENRKCYEICPDK